jgi:hypothetical protein
MGVVCGYLSLFTTLNTVAYTQFDKLKADMIDIRQQHITSRHGEEDEQDNAFAKCDLQAKINACIRHHQEIVE